jgi:hypothetical protein
VLVADELAEVEDQPAGDLALAREHDVDAQLGGRVLIVSTCLAVGAGS